MKHCHECDSEVADNDTFCPYCGISIQGVAVGAAVDDDAFSSTIVISSPASIPQAVAEEPVIEEPKIPAAPPALDDEEEAGDVGSVLEPIDVVDKTIETSLPLGDYEEPKDVSVTEGSIEIHTSPDHDISADLRETEVVDSDDEIDTAETKDEVADQPCIAERLTGAIGSISGRFTEPTAMELAEVDSEPVEGPSPADEHQDPEAEAESEPVVEAEDNNLTRAIAAERETIDEDSNALSKGEFDAAAEDDAEQMPTNEDIDVSISDVPTPILLSSEEIDNTIGKLGDPDLGAGEVGIDMPSDVPVADEAADNEYRPGNAIIPAVMNVVSELRGDDKPSSEVPESRAEDRIESSHPAADLGADLDLVMPSDTVSEEDPEIEPAVAVVDGPLQPEVSESEEAVEANEARVSVMDEPLQRTGANTGDDLSEADPIGGTKPNIGSTDTDGRKSGLKPLSEGTVLNNRYDIVRKIGGGGMGAVYLANDRNLGGVQRAVKEMVQSHIEEEQQDKAVEDFKRESTILSTLDHPSIPTIYDYFFDAQEGRFYLVMKYISGGDLAGKLRATPEGRIDERTVCEWALQIIDVLDYLHNLPTKIVYRDLKPSNVMIDGNTGRIMLIDFGIARSINQNQEKGVTAVGTMGYAPPELFSGNVEPRSDIYSLGSTMFHLLTGADPQNNPLLIFDFQKNPRPRQINPQLSDQIERILMRSVEYNADARFESAAEMKHALAAHIDNLKTGQITYGVTEVPQSVSLSHQIVFCGFCGQRIVATDMFCAFCGSKQPLAQHGVHSEVYSRSVGTARLVIEGTSDLTAPAYGLEKNENLVGRRDPMSNIFPEVDLSKYDPQTKISRRHAKIWRDGTSYLLEDLGSSNGTILLTQISDTLRLMPHQPHPLASGDRIRIGDTTLQFIVG